MTNAIAFFPWVSIDEPITIGEIKLLPYERKRLPGNLSDVTQRDIDDVLGAYAPTPRRKVRKATIVELDEWESGTEPQDVVDKLFRVRNLIAFSALARRRLFSGHIGYCNYDAYSLVVQRFRPGDAKGFVFSTRRRDGGTRQYWTSDEFAFHRPRHVDANIQVDVETDLLKALQELGPNDDYLYEALVEFNCANTDSPDVPIHVEVVMMKSAFERLYSINQNADSFCNALQSALADIPLRDTDGPLKSKWGSRLKTVPRPLLAWAREFCDVRGDSAHGKQRNPARFVWSHHAHLAFCATLFPLLFKKKLADLGRMELDEVDIEKLKCIESYLMHDPFTFDSDGESLMHPWQDIDMRARTMSIPNWLCPTTLALIESLSESDQS